MSDIVRLFGKPIADCTRGELEEGIRVLIHQVERLQGAHHRTMENGSTIIGFLQRQIGKSRTCD